MPKTDNTTPANGRVAVLCLAVVVGMIGMSYAAVPLYRIFCQVTGYGGTTQRADAPPQDTVIERVMTVRFDANTSSALAWTFEPAQKQAEVKVGEQAMAFYRATNTSSETLTGTATFNVSPPRAGAYFSKVECFCFTEQTLKPGQSVDMPVVYFVDPDIDSDPDLKALRTITLSYTFYPAERDSETDIVATPSGERSQIN